MSAKFALTLKLNKTYLRRTAPSRCTNSKPSRLPADLKTWPIRVVATFAALLTGAADTHRRRDAHDGRKAACCQQHAQADARVRRHQKRAHRRRVDGEQTEIHSVTSRHERRLAVEDA